MQITVNEGLYFELADFSYFFLSLVSLEIITSFFFTVDGNNNIRRTFSNQFQSTGYYLIWIIVIALGYYLGEKLLSDKIVELLITVENTLIPFAVFSISFFAFYTTKVMLGRRWQFRHSISTLIITVIFLGLSMFMYLNGNTLGIEQYLS